MGALLSNGGGEILSSQPLIAFRRLRRGDSYLISNRSKLLTYRDWKKIEKAHVIDNKGK